MCICGWWQYTINSRQDAPTSAIAVQWGGVNTSSYVNNDAVVAYVLLAYAYKRAVECVNT